MSVTFVDCGQTSQRIKLNFGVWATLDSTTVAYSDRLMYALMDLDKEDKNSSENEIANVNILGRHRTCRGQRLRPLN